MQAISISKPGAAPQVLNDAAIPEPGEDQILVKTLYTAINPVDDLMAQYGSLVLSWPFVPGCDVAGIVVKVGAKAVSAFGRTWEEGDRVFGCTRLGSPGYTAWGAFFLFDAPLCMPVPPNLSLAEAAGTGVGLLTASLGLFMCLNIPLPNPASLPGPRNEWALVFGGAGSVGQFAVQLFKVAGFQVVATSSAKSFELLKALGADAVVDYKQATPEIIRQVAQITNNTFAYAFDAVSTNNPLITSIYAALAPTQSERRFTTTNDWDPLPEGDFTVQPIQLGPIGQHDALELNKSLREIIPVVYELLRLKCVKPSKYSIEGEGFEGVLKAWEVQRSGVKGSTKVVVKVAE